MVYPIKEGLVPFRRDNCAKCAANTWKKVPRPSNHRAGKLSAVGPRKLLAETKSAAAYAADVIVDAGQRSRSAPLVGESVIG